MRGAPRHPVPHRYSYAEEPGRENVYAQGEGRPLSLQPLPLHCEHLALPTSREEDYRPLPTRPLPLYCENSGSASPKEEDRPLSLQPLPLHYEHLALPAPPEEEYLPLPLRPPSLPLHHGHSGSAPPKEEDRPLSLQPLPLHCEHLALPASREEDQVSFDKLTMLYMSPPSRPAPGLSQGATKLPSGGSRPIRGSSAMRWPTSTQRPRPKEDNPIVTSRTSTDGRPAYLT